MAQVKPDTDVDSIKTSHGRSADLKKCRLCCDMEEGCVSASVSSCSDEGLNSHLGERTCQLKKSSFTVAQGWRRGLKLQPPVDAYSAASLSLSLFLLCRTSFVLHRAPLEGLDANESGLGTRFRALSLDTENDHEQQAGAPQGGGGVDAGAAGPPLPRGPVVLILDDSLQALPWESLPALRSQRWSPTLLARESSKVMAL